MKRTMHVNKPARYIGFILLILVLTLTSLGAVSPAQIEQESISQIAIVKYVEAQQNPNLNDEEKIKSAIDAYFTTRYEGQKLLKQQNFSPLLDDDSLNWVKKEKDKREVELYIASLFDLKYASYKYMLDYDSIEIKNNKAIVQLRESHEVIFEPIAPEVSKLGGLPHKLTLHKKQDGWVIYKDEYQDELSQQLDHMTKDEIKDQVDENYQIEINRKEKARQLGNKIQAMTMPNVVTLTNYAYSGSAAANYADTYWQYYNTTWYKTNPGTDCASFVSQAMYAGEGKSPPNTSGMTTSPSRSYYTDWYYVFNNPAGTQNGSGSLPWVRVQEQYDFIRLNTNKIGPYGYVVSSGSGTVFCDLGQGGIVQLYNVAGQGTWDHEGIVVQIGNCTQMAWVLVDAHTTNRYHYPLSYWSGYNQRYIHISGWRGN